jgi:hypothetical protein
LSKCSCTAIALVFKRLLSAPYSTLFQHFHRFCEILDDHFFIIFHFLEILFNPLTFLQLLPHKPRRALHKCRLDSFLISHKI